MSKENKLTFFLLNQTLDSLLCPPIQGQLAHFALIDARTNSYKHHQVKDAKTCSHVKKKETVKSSSFQPKRKAFFKIVCTICKKHKMWYDYFFYIVVSTGSIAQDTSVSTDKSVIIGAGVGAGFIFISIVIMGGLIFIARKRQINRRNGKCFTWSNTFVKYCF